MLKNTYTFINGSMEKDVVDEKTNKVLNYKTIVAVSTSEEEARNKAHRSKIDTSGTLDPEWELKSVNLLNKEWQDDPR